MGSNEWEFMREQFIASYEHRNKASTTPHRIQDTAEEIFPEKIGGTGKEIDVTINFKDAAFVRSHFDAMAVRVDDAPRAGEIVVALVVTDCGRPHPRIGGLNKKEAKMEDGFR